MTLLQGSKGVKCTSVVTAFAEGKCTRHMDGGRGICSHVTVVKVSVHTLTL